MMRIGFGDEWWPGGSDDDAGDSGGRSGEREREKRERKKKAGADLKKIPPVARTGLTRLVDTCCKLAGPPVMPQHLA
jgi:hypothetical protein